MGFTRRMAALRCSVGLPENACGRAGCGRAYAAVQKELSVEHKSQRAGPNEFSFRTPEELDSVIK